MHVRSERAGPVVAMSADLGVTHRKAYRSWWDGHIVGLCGAVARAGEWHYVWVPWWGEERCLDCDRIHRDGGE